MKNYIGSLLLAPFVLLSPASATAQEVEARDGPKRLADMSAEERAALEQQRTEALNASKRFRQRRAGAKERQRKLRLQRATERALKRRTEAMSKPAQSFRARIEAVADGGVLISQPYNPARTRFFRASGYDVVLSVESGQLVPDKSLYKNRRYEWFFYDRQLVNKLVARSMVGSEAKVQMHRFGKRRVITALNPL